VAVTEGTDKAGQIGQEIKQELVHPRWESFKAFTKDLGPQSWRQLKTNARAMARELGYVPTQELDTKIPKRTSFSSRTIKHESMARKVMRNFTLRT